MAGAFDQDSHPGRPRVLFIGLGGSTHTHSWIDLLADSRLNARLFALPAGGLPPAGWKVRTYVSAYAVADMDEAWRARLYSPVLLRRLSQRVLARARYGTDGFEELAEEWLAQVIRRWRPDVIHTLGIDPASYFYLKAREKYGLRGIGKWVAQARGGPDIALNRLVAEHSGRIKEVLGECDRLVADNEQNYQYALGLGLAPHKVSSLGVVPGTGGVDVARLSAARRGRPSESRIVLWPKAYESLQGKALPVFEAMKLVWEQIQPCEFHLLAMTAETSLWFQTLPEEIRRACRCETRVSRDHVLELMTRARVMLAPSLADGIPNSMYEAMAAGAFPVVSPLETISPLVENGRNVLFARNLYPHEIAEVLRLAMTDDALIDGAVERNLSFVRRLADRASIGPRVVRFYEEVMR